MYARVIYLILVTLLGKIVIIKKCNKTLQKEDRCNLAVHVLYILSLSLSVWWKLVMGDIQLFCLHLPESHRVWSIVS